MVNTDEWFMRGSPPRLIIKWDRFDLSWAESDVVDVELYGYYEDDYGPHFDFLGVSDQSNRLFLKSSNLNELSILTASSLRRTRPTRDHTASMWPRIELEIKN